MRDIFMLLLASGSTVLLTSCMVRNTSEGPPRSMQADEPVVSTTIDFLDYCWFFTDPEVGYYTLEQYEDVIRSLAEAGIQKVYLRVDVCGLTLYPTRVGKRYAGDGREPGSTWLVNTLERYDPAAETIRLCRKYGLEPWAWDTLFDDNATTVHWAPSTEEHRNYGEYPLWDPFLADNPRFRWRLDPRRSEWVEQRRAAAQDAGPIERIRITSDTSRNNRVQAEDFLIYVSEDNATWDLVDAEWSFSVIQEKPPVLLIEGLSIEEPYIKLAWKDPEWTGDRAWTVSGEGWTFAEGEWDGDWHPLLADFYEQRDTPDRGGFSFQPVGRFAWDWSRRAMGLTRLPPLHKYGGMAEMGWPEVRAHKLAKLRELADYDFDGFAYSLRTHDRFGEPEHYGFGEPIREAFLERYGVDIWTEDFDREAWLALRAEFVEQYLRKAAGMLAPRPLFVDWIYPESRYAGAYGGLPFRPEHWVDEDKGVAGIRVLGAPRNENLPPNPAGRPELKTVRFVDNHDVPPEDKFREQLRRWLNDPGLDEVEYYETMLYTPMRPDYLRIIREEQDRLTHP